MTWVQANDEVAATEVWDSQCRAIDRKALTEQPGFQAEGADKACAASGKVDGSDAATIAAISNNEIVTVRLSSLPPGKPAAMTEATAMLEGVLDSVAGKS